MTADVVLSVRTRHRGNLGVLLVSIVGAILVVGPFIFRSDPNAIDLKRRFNGPSPQHPLGTDDLGRDLLARLIHGGRSTILIAVGAVVLASAIAIPCGLALGYTRRWVDVVFARVIDVFLAVPSLLLAIGIVGILGPSASTTVVALGLSYWPFYARLVRAEVISICSRAYVDAARVIGASGWRIIRRDVFVALTPLILVQSGVLFGFAILDEAGLGFLGLGVAPPNASWGAMIAEARQFILSEPDLAIIAGVPVLVTVYGVNLCIDQLRDRLDPQADR